MKKLTRLILSAGLILALMYAPAPAAAADPDPSTNRVLAEFMKGGVKIYFMGAQLGFNGWFLVKDNQVQIIYTSLDNQNALVGVLFNAQGDDVTSQQVKTLYDTNKDVNALITALNNSQQSATGTGVAEVAGVMPAGNTALAPPASPGERLMKALEAAAGVNVGTGTAPKIFMVADPNCPHCQATWKMLRPAIFAGKVQIRLVPISNGTADADSERAAAQFLRTVNPLDAWDKYVGGDHTQLAGTPDAGSVTAVANNHKLINSWHIQMTPFIVYRAKDGQIKIVQGEPEQGAAMIDDVAP